MATSLERYTYEANLGSVSRLSTVAELLKSRIGKEAAITMNNEGNCVPENLVFEILSWLPVKALLRFKCVCKSWYAIITSRQFVSKHLQNVYNNSENNSECLLIAQYHEASTIKLEMMLLDETPKVVANSELSFAPMHGRYVCGPCDGIYYLYVDYRTERERALWNPVTNELKMLPPLVPNPDLSPNLTYTGFDVYSFGYDSLSKDYKVVVIKHYWAADPDIRSEVTPDHPPSVLVYSLRTDSWRFWGDLAKNYEVDTMNTKCYVFLRDCCYWLGSCAQSTDTDTTDVVIICFDLAADAPREIRVPDDFGQPINNYKRLGVFQDSVALVAIHCAEMEKHPNLGTHWVDVEKHLNIWTLSDEGLWTKVFTMVTRLNFYMPLSFYKENKLLLELNDHNIVSCDLDTHVFSHFCFPLGITCEGVFDYKESLVSIKDQIAV